jgi:mannose-6-phosphate isomerase-like protein (cupin superfamily)
MATMVKHVTRNVNQPDEVREFLDGRGNMKVLELGEETLGYATFEPGWMWSKHVGPKAGTDSCHVTHNLFVISGRMHVRMDDGDEFEIGPGDAVFIGPGHDAWTIGDEACVCADWTGARTYATEHHEH